MTQVKLVGNEIKNEKKGQKISKTIPPEGKGSGKFEEGGVKITDKRRHDGVG